MDQSTGETLPYSVFLKATLAPYRLIERGAPLPAECVFEMCTGQDLQTSIELHLLKGEVEEQKRLQTFARYMIEEIPALPRGEFRAKIILTIAREGEYDLKVSRADRENYHDLRLRVLD
jgi:molecular chaperone DnaK (HSP70)